MNKPIVAAVQMNVCEDKMRNIDNALMFINKAAEQNADIVVLPEMFNCPYKTSNFPVYAEIEGGECYSLLADAAATAVGNIIKTIKDIEQGLIYAQKIPGVKGVVIIKDDKMGLWGDINFSVF